jgi:hypothetical protein
MYPMPPYLPDDSALLKLLHPPGIRSMTLKPLDLSEDGAAWANSVQNLVTEILMTAQHSSPPRTTAAPPDVDVDDGAPGPSEEDEQPKMRGRSPSEVKARVAALAAKRMTGSASSPKSPGSPASVSPQSPAAFQSAAFSTEESAVGLKPSEVKAQAAARLGPSPLGGGAPSPRPPTSPNKQSENWARRLSALAVDETAAGLKPSEIKAQVPPRGLSKRNSTTLVPLEKLSLAETCTLMTNLGLAKYLEAIKDARVNGAKLTKADDAALVELGLSGLHRRTLLGRLDEFRSAGVPGSIILPDEA